MTNIKNKILMFILLLVGIVQGCHSTTSGNTAISVPLNDSTAGIHIDTRAENLKGNVKSVRCLVYDSVAKNKVPILKIHRDTKDFIGHIEFYKLGLRKIINMGFIFLDSISQPIDTESNSYFTYLQKDFEKKSKYKPRINIPYPAYNPLLVHLNEYSPGVLYEGKPGQKLPHAWDGNLDSIPEDLTQDIYLYIYDDKKRIKQEVEYWLPYNKYILEEDKIDKYYIHSRTTYEYDKQGQLISQKIVASENDRDPMFSEFSINGMDFSVFDDFRRTFSYDEKGRLKNFSFYVNNRLATSETYTYDKKKGYISEIKRFIISRLTNHGYETDNSVEKYDENGHLTQATLYPDMPDKPVKTRYYEYTLDAHKNWVECRMYLEGRTEKPTLIAKRIIEYYE